MEVNVELYCVIPIEIINKLINYKIMQSFMSREYYLYRSEIFNKMDGNSLFK